MKFSQVKKSMSSSLKDQEEWYLQPRREKTRGFQKEDTARGKEQWHKLVIMSRVLLVLRCVEYKVSGRKQQELGCRGRQGIVCTARTDLFYSFAPKMSILSYFHIPETRMDLSWGGLWQALPFEILLLPAYVQTQS